MLKSHRNLAKNHQFLLKIIKNHEFDITDGLESCASKFCASSTKNQIFRPPGCRDWAQTLSRSKKKCLRAQPRLSGMFEKCSLKRKTPRLHSFTANMDSSHVPDKDFSQILIGSLGLGTLLITNLCQKELHMGFFSGWECNGGLRQSPQQHNRREGCDHQGGDWYHGGNL